MTWREEAACRGMSIDLFFPDTALGVAQARSICRGCPVQAQCLSEAVFFHEDDGVWGGTCATERDGRMLSRWKRERIA